MVLPLPENIHARREAATLFTERYEVIATIEIRGQVPLQDSAIRLFPDGVTWNRLGAILDQIGLGNGTEMPEDAHTQESTGEGRQRRQYMDRVRKQ
ncbi:hypothetical protein [Ktedonospora formicarum]|uniref:Uncharacterized protein n=1 Tax=Ktedonospora formicarum TaxID=2778364 RepID=A0A8J3I7S1_9CHLR|nr:hypothetical protein [Ktedonospora formicarum]GHO47373.1 hypothetical protein KSX_55360 [Ktedonospora formicarum]